MFWFMGILAGILLSVADIFLLTRKKTASSCILAVVRDVIVSNAAALGLMSFVLKIPNMFVFS